MTPIPISTSRLNLGEGARWVDGVLYVVDLLAGQLLRAGTDVDAPLIKVTSVGAPLGAVAPISGTEGGWLAAMGTGIAVVDDAGAVKWVARPELANPTPARMNDAAVDPMGRFWAGSMAIDGSPHAGSLYRMDVDGVVRRVVTGLSVTNGPAFNHAGDVMYLADSAQGVIDRFTVDTRTGELFNREPFVRIEERGSSPDGMTVDSAGFLWSAIWGGGRVVRYSPNGVLADTIMVPASQPTSVCLGGDDARQLFITTAIVGLAAPGPEDGAVFRVQVDVPGFPQPRAFMP